MLRHMERDLLLTSNALRMLHDLAVLLLKLLHLLAIRAELV